MEMIAGRTHHAIPIGDPSAVGEARRHATRLAGELDWGEVDTSRAALVVTELASNLLKHAQRGRLLLASNRASNELEVITLDQGPGIADPARCMGDGYSTGSSPGSGLGAVKRLSQSFDLHSSVPQGTVAVARLRPASVPLLPKGRIEVGALCLPAPSESVSGDAWCACFDGARAALSVADGLGHGPDAQEAALAAMAVFGRQPFTDLRNTLREAHGVLRVTRGAAVTCLILDADEADLRIAGVGNVLARVISGVYDRTLMVQSGTLGVQIRGLDEVRLPWPEHAIVVVHTDGIESRWKPELLLPVLGRDPALAAGLLMRDHCRGRDDATVVVLRRNN